MGSGFPLSEKHFFLISPTDAFIPFASAEITRDVEAGSPCVPVPSSSAVKMKSGLGREARELEKLESRPDNLLSALSKINK